MKPVFKGVCTALITPLTENGVDYEALGRLIDWQIEQGINGLLIAGTTGEGSTLSDEEHRELLKFAIEKAAGRVPMIAGTGSNDTAYAIDMTKYACEIGYDACLLVTPYYNKTTQNGLVAMFKAIADASTKPLILYNIAGRTGINIEAKTFAKMKGYPNIAAVKEASGNISQVADVMMYVGDEMAVYSGNDDQIIPILSLGGSGVISVLSNVMPKETVELCEAFFSGDTKKAAELQIRYLPLIHALFSEVNPIPVKRAMAEMGFGKNIVRLPLVPMEEAHAEVMLEEMRKLNLI